MYPSRSFTKNLNYLGIGTIDKLYVGVPPCREGKLNQIRDSNFTLQQQLQQQQQQTATTAQLQNPVFLDAEQLAKEIQIL
ncbi:MAG: hypothetical protein RBG13Loki_0087 [Promethearchaeota archaeon CR_4]|nr:MAG: hypothetical protein RBG13Loki_0087 [Candidatus Lokiarchaeota archaeon CR_4]